MDVKSCVIKCFACVTQLEGADTEDFESVNAAVLLLSNESSKTIQIGVKDDDLPEADETFTFNLTVQVKPHFACKPLCVWQLVRAAKRLFVDWWSLHFLLHTPLAGAPGFLSTKFHRSNSVPSCLKP